MNLEELKERKCPELLFKSIEIADENIKWGDFIQPDHKSFKVDHSMEVLKQCFVRIPVFSDEQMLGLQYVQANNSGETVHESYCLFSDFVVDYKRAGIAKITQRFGVKVFKRSEEKFLDPIVLETKEFHFFYDFKADSPRWTYLNQPEIFDQMRDEIEALRSTNEIRNIHRTYFNSRIQTEKELKSATLGTEKSYGDYLTEWNYLIKNAVAFHENKHLFGEIPDFNFLKINNELIEVKNKLESVEKRTEDLKLVNSTKATNRSDDENRLIIAFADLLSSFKSKFHTPGYWINDGEIYPNICEIYNLLQPAATNRNAQTKYALKLRYVLQSEKENLDFIPL